MDDLRRQQARLVVVLQKRLEVKRMLIAISDMLSQKLLPLGFGNAVVDGLGPPTEEVKQMVLESARKCLAHIGSPIRVELPSFEEQVAYRLSGDNRDTIHLKMVVPTDLVEISINSDT